MKKLNTFLFAFLFLLASCSSDDDNNSSSSDFTIDGQSFNVTDAKATDNYHFFNNTHSEFDFALSDGTITVTAEPETVYGFETENASFAIDLSIASLGNTFQNGVYQFDEYGDESSNYSFFDDLIIYIDGNGNHEFFDIQDSYLYATAGTVTVSGSAPNYTLAFDVTLSNNEHFQYTYNGGFDYIDNRND